METIDKLIVKISEFQESDNNFDNAKTQGKATMNNIINKCGTKHILYKLVGIKNDIYAIIDYNNCIQQMINEKTLKELSKDEYEYILINDPDSVYDIFLKEPWVF